MLITPRSTSHTASDGSRCFQTRSLRAGAQLPGDLEESRSCAWRPSGRCRCELSWGDPRGWSPCWLHCAFPGQSRPPVWGRHRHPFGRQSACPAPRVWTEKYGCCWGRNPLVRPEGRSLCGCRSSVIGLGCGQVSEEPSLAGGSGLCPGDGHLLTARRPHSPWAPAPSRTPALGRGHACPSPLPEGSRHRSSTCRLWASAQGHPLTGDTSPVLQGSASKRKGAREKMEI